MAKAIRHELANLSRKEIDAEFALMAEDTEYLTSAEQIDATFAIASWEAINQGNEDE